MITFKRGWHLWKHWRAFHSHSNSGTLFCQNRITEKNTHATRSVTLFNDQRFLDVLAERRATVCPFGQQLGVQVVDLSYDLYEGSVLGPPLVLLHGLFGSKSNFQTIARALVRKTGRKVLTLDARNHGCSPHDDIMTYPAMSADVCQILHQLQITNCVLIGHSMGGKTAMTVALQEPKLVERLVSVDISPAPTVPQTGFPHYIAAMQKVHFEGKMPRSTARRLADEQLSSTVKEASIRQFLLTNLVQENGTFKWRVNLEVITRHLQDLLDFPEFQDPYPGPVLFLGGANSPYISSENYPEIERLFPFANVEYIFGAGHWVHADKTHDFLNAICNFVESA